ncbi:MAG: oligosaccharide flippase family protein [Parasphingorhabdus sp.]|nr:oligosaccharide flippase family protein [Parasphingorhabdus sp.]
MIALAQRYRKFLVGGAVLTMGSGGAQLLMLVRNFVVARLISPENFGIAAAMAATLSAIETTSSLGWDKFLIQDREGDSPRLIAALHAIMLIRGAILALAIYFAAEPLARLFDVPEAAGAFQILAIAPLIRGFSHLDMRWYERSFRFSPEQSLQLACAVAGLVVSVAIAKFVVADYHAMLWGIVAIASTYTVGSHILAERPYQAIFHREYLIRMVHFGWPLLLSSVIVFAGMQGDRLLVGAQLGVTELALYAAAAMIISAPTVLMLKVAGSVSLPALADRGQGTAGMAGKVKKLGTLYAAIALGIYIPALLLGDFALALTFGQKYISDVPILKIMVIANFLIFMRGRATSVALALGDTRNLLISSSIRISGIALAVLSLHFGFGVLGVASSIAFGEFLATIAAILRVKGFFPEYEMRSDLITMAIFAIFTATIFTVQGLI